jgi:hypothetical protein
VWSTPPHCYGFPGKNLDETLYRFCVIAANFRDGTYRLLADFPDAAFSPQFSPSLLNPHSPDRFDEKHILAALNRQSAVLAALADPHQIRLGWL